MDGESAHRSQLIGRIGMTKSKLWIIGIGSVAMLSLIATAISLLNQPYTFRGSLIDPPVRAAEITLTDQQGQLFRLSDEKGKVVLIFFGYTSCPDVCPTTLAQFKRIRAELGKQSDRVRFVFITVDPERDTPQRIRDYIAAFDASFIGLTGAMADLETVWKNFGVYRAKRTGDSAFGYLMEHTARVYTVDMNGNLRVTYPYGMNTDDLVRDVSYLVGEK